MDKGALVHRPGGGRHLVSDTGLAIVCRDPSQLFLAEKGEKERVLREKKRGGGVSQSQETLHLESPECVAGFPTRAGADLEELCNVAGSL